MEFHYLSFRISYTHLYVKGIMAKCKDNIVNIQKLIIFQHIYSIQKVNFKNLCNESRLVDNLIVCFPHYIAKLVSEKLYLQLEPKKCSGTHMVNVNKWCRFYNRNKKGPFKR